MTQGQCTPLSSIEWMDHRTLHKMTAFWPLPLQHSPHGSVCSSGSACLVCRRLAGRRVGPSSGWHSGRLSPSDHKQVPSSLECEPDHLDPHTKGIKYIMLVCVCVPFTHSPSPYLSVHQGGPLSHASPQTRHPPLVVGPYLPCPSHKPKVIFEPAKNEDKEEKTIIKF